MRSETVEKVLLGVTLTLLAFGLIMIASGGALYAATRFESTWFFVQRQAIAAAIGIGALFILRRIDYHVWQRVATVVMLIATVLLIALLIPGVAQEVYGAKRWLTVGPLSLQPAELMKVALIFYLAALFAARIKAVRDFYEGLLPFTFVVGGVGFLLVLQPDVGTLCVMAVIAGTMFFVAGARIQHIAILIGAGLAALAALIALAPYRLQRFMTFLDPAADPQGAGYQVLQGLIAIGAGGVVGRGLGHGLQKFHYLPEPVGDSIFAVIAEEWGFVGTVAFLGLFALFAYCGYTAARRAPDMFGRLVAVGITTWIMVQAFFNIAAMTALMPLTGIPLPLISYGSTALVVTLAAIGILLNIARQARRV